MVKEPLKEALIRFLSDVPAKRLKQNMVKILLDFLKRHGKEGLPNFADDLFADLEPFFDLLDVIDKEVDQSALL